MNKRPVIQICIPRTLRREKWILKEIFLRIGYPFVFAAKWNGVPIKISYMISNENEDLLIPEASQGWQKIDEPEVSLIGGYCIAHPRNEKPAGIIKENRLLFDIVGMGRYFLTGQAKKCDYPTAYRMCREKFSCFDFPALDVAAKVIEKIIRRKLVERGLERFDDLNSKPFQKPVVAVTHDVDHIIIGGISNFLKLLQQTFHIMVKQRGNKFQGIYSLLRKSLLGLFKNGLSGDQVPLQETIDIEKMHEIKSTFFVYAGESVLPYNPTYDIFEKVEEIQIFLDKLKKSIDQGWNVGLHGSTYSAESTRKLTSELCKLKEKLAPETALNRFHRLTFDQGSTFDHLKASLVALDSSLGFNKRLGFICGTAYPYFLFDQSTDGFLGPVLEIPISIQDNPLIREEGLKWEKLIERSILLIESLSKSETSGVVNILWHMEAFFRFNSSENGLAFYDQYLKKLSEQQITFMTLSEINQTWREYVKKVLIE